MMARWTWGHTLGVVLLAGGVVLVGAASAYGTSEADSRWGLWSLLLLAGILVGILAVIGHRLVRRLDGALIDGRFRISLAQFQLVVWTVLVLSTWGAAVFTNLGIDNPGTDPFDVTIPTELWLALGISATSFGSARLIQGRDMDHNPPPTESFQAIGDNDRSAMIHSRGDDPSKWAARGKLLVRIDPKDASWGDLFASDDADSGGVPDISKIQMFFFTIVLAFGYAVACADLFATPDDPVTGLPAVSEAFAILLGISQGSYLVKKGVDLRGT